MRVYKVEVQYNENFLELRPVKRIGNKLSIDREVLADLRYRMNIEKGRLMRDIWKPFLVAPSIGRAGSLTADFSYLDVTTPIAITERAFHALSDVMNAPGHGELLPLEGADDRNYYLFNPPVIDALDLENCLVVWTGRGERKRISEVLVYAFFADRLRDAWLFRTPYEGDSSFLATGAFKKRVEAANLTNLHLKLVWDSEDSNYYDERYTPEQWQAFRQKLHQQKGISSSETKTLEPTEIQVAHSYLNGVIEARSLSAKDKVYFKGYVDVALNILQQYSDTAITVQTDPKIIVQYLQSAIDSLRENCDAQEVSILLGMLWGEQIVRTYGWYWINLRDARERNSEWAVVSPDNAFYIWPARMVSEYIDNPQEHNLLVSKFNMIGMTKEFQAIAKPGQYVRLG